MKKMLLVMTMALSLAVFVPEHVLGQPMDFGDAPEGAPAYPSLGVTGAFPTCITVGPATWIQHTNFGAWFGPAIDFELDGNGGLCPSFAPYDNDECFMDGDAGLLIPPAYTIVQGVVTLCPNATAGSLGLTCQTAVWGPNVDIDVHNTMPGHEPYLPAYVNVLMDWDQNGMWGGSSPCPPAGTPAPEHVLVNFVVPPLFIGPLSALLPPPFLIGPNPGYVWTRFTISERPVLAQDWDGSEGFEDGESEDYLLHVDAGDPTVYPVVETECPVIDTQCPEQPVETECPEETTVCPSITTACPVNATVCPAIPTVCPESYTVCPEEYTICPDDDPTVCVMTECPDRETLCPEEPTVCPKEDTVCANHATYCPIEPTWCPFYYTECPMEPTFCPMGPTECEFTQCEWIETFCPYEETLCPIEGAFTYCPFNPTWCPDDYTYCPVEDTMCPVIDTFCPETQTECPIEEITICPSGTTWCPEVPTVCPQLDTFCPDNNPTVCEITNCPVVDTVCPLIDTTCPAEACVPPCRADLDADQEVGLFDLIIMKNEYGTDDCDPTDPLKCCKADIDGDGEVGLFDLIIMKNEYGRDDCPPRIPPCTFP